MLEQDRECCGLWIKYSSCSRLCSEDHEVEEAEEVDRLDEEDDLERACCSSDLWSSM